MIRVAHFLETESFPQLCECKEISYSFYTYLAASVLYEDLSFSQFTSAEQN